MPLESSARISFESPSYTRATGDPTRVSSSERGLNLLSTDLRPRPLSSRTHEVPAEQKKSYLNLGIDTITSRLIHDDHTREEVNHYGCEFLKTASLFARGKAGVIGTILAYGADQASPDDKRADRMANFALGSAKGITLKGLFSVIGARATFAPTKGALMGLAARSTDIVYRRETFADPNLAVTRLQSEALSRNVMLMDAALLMAGETVFSGVNAWSGGAIARNRTLAGMAMGGSFGLVNGSFAEASRQLQTGERDPLKILTRGGIEASVSALGAGFGIKASDPALHAKIGRRAGDVLEAVGLNPRPSSREFVITGGIPELQKFVRDEKAHTVASVREVKRLFGYERIGRERQIIVQHAEDGKTRPLPALADFVASCNPEKLGAPARAAHLFPRGRGPLFMELGSENRLRLSIGDSVRPWRYNESGNRLRLGGPEVTVNVMAPLLIGNPDNVHDPSRIHEWHSFQHQLSRAAKLGVDGVSTDVWWGIVEPKPGQFRWSYYDHLSTRIIGTGLKWIPIMSFHACGGNVGDTINVPVPSWVWSHVAKSMGSNNPDAGKYVSEQGNTNHEYVQVWSTDHALPLYERVLHAFQTQYAGKAHAIPEVNISLGPAGEARYPSYNSHDSNTGWPSRGALQAYSEAAVKAFREWALREFGGESGVRSRWGDEYGRNIGPPRDVENFFRNNHHHNTQYGRDFFDWYSNSLIDHGKKVLSTALKVYGPGSPFQTAEIGFKLPGVHWRMGYHEGGKIVIGDRLAELAAGLIRTSTNDWHSDELGRGYRPIIRGFADLLQQPGGSRVVLHFTCLEMQDGVDGAKANSLPHSLATWVGREARLAGLPIKGENALGWNLPNPNSWHTMAGHLDLPGQQGLYRGLTLLRLSDVLSSDTGAWHIEALINGINARRHSPPAAAAEKTG